MLNLLAAKATTAIWAAGAYPDDPTATGTATTAPAANGGATWNPLSGVSPNLSVFGTTFTSKTGRVLGGIWALVLFILAAYVLLAFAKWGRARRQGHDPDEISAGAGELKKALMAFGGAVAASAVLGAVIALVQ